MGTSVRERAIALLGQNIKQSLVAQTVGVTDSYISQLLTEDAVRMEIATLRAGKLEDAVAKDDTIEDIEKLALQRVKNGLQYLNKGPLEAARIFKIMNEARRATQDTPNDGGDGVQIIQITLPKAARTSVKIQLNEQNQVIDVEGRSMAPLPSRALPTLAQHRKNIAEVEVKQLPPPVVQDTELAADKLRTLPDIITIMDGVQLVL